MTAYQRFVAYVYEYRKEQKKENRGFLKVEVRGGECLIDIHLQCPACAAGQICRIYGFVRNGGALDGVPLGECLTKSGKLEHRIRTDAGRLNGQQAAIGELGGIVLLTGGCFYGTEWDDISIVPAAFAVRKEQTEAYVPKETAPEETVRPILEPKAGAEVLPEAEKEKAEEENTNEEEEAKRGEMTAESVEEAETAETERMEEVVEETKKNVPAEETKLYKAPERQTFEEFLPFEDGEITDCTKITMKDFGCLHKKDVALRHNRFLLYGCQHFGYLLLGRLRGKEQYVLGVPGVYDRQERFMANMFGFPHFKRSRTLDPYLAQGGYWYRMIEAPAHKKAED